jgi:hypothetical protein
MLVRRKGPHFGGEEGDFRHINLQKSTHPPLLGHTKPLRFCNLPGMGLFRKFF